MMKKNLIALAVVAMLAGCDENETPPKEKKLDYYTQSFEIPDLGFEPQLLVDYEYDASGKLSKYTVFGYDPSAASFNELRNFLFFPDETGRVKEIKGYLPNNTGAPYVEYTYQYLADGNVSTINENNHATGITSEAKFTYDSVNEAVKVSYTFSNGGAFDYEFQFVDKNVASDKTSRGSQHCSDGVYTYDEKINPFKKLGYVDFLLTNLSANNKLTEIVNYVGCAFPSLIPESYIHEYDDSGYPVISTTIYKHHGTKSRQEFFYE